MYFHIHSPGVIPSRDGVKANTAQCGLVVAMINPGSFLRRCKCVVGLIPFPANFRIISLRATCNRIQTEARNCRPEG